MEWQRTYWKEKCLNPKCDEKHLVMRCQITPKDLRYKLLRDYRARKDAERPPRKKVGAYHK